ncbi:MAG: YicC/YloC family endoribonuclease [Phenylobacterium sp.]|uniref:YicC/YloC family endoribonuclease n=1 Tax=Phenylobacterium sp. TaxID=1871053 RepID=UPI00271ECFE2|nr:YicC/YloC family endoribonuclease [Phenylobacterium sp.]MDO8910465.1 YicC/YloC family endoribonuclease [Phenylobacterium sp.]MDP3101294.1 YicC/YloC family endoribonuclease [Phenylobacterium sp.]
MPLSGMTGFGRAEAACGDWSWSVEARSVNGRNLEIRYRGIPGFDALDRTAREAAQARFQRGNVTIGITGKRTDPGGKVTINLDQVERYLAVGAQLVADGRATTPSLDGLLALRGVIEAGETADDPETLAAVEAAMAASLNGALDALLANRREEGAALAIVLAGQIDRVAVLVTQAETEAAGQSAAIKERFERRMNELAPDTPGIAERIVVEAAALAVKADVREELDRLAGHVDAARSLMAGEGPAGRRLDFLTQEFMREANTLCSKSALPGLTTVGLELKATIEQFREQVQNVE